MAKTLTAADRSALIRLASTMGKGSPERRAILVGLKKTARHLHARPGPGPVQSFWDALVKDGIRVVKLMGNSKAVVLDIKLKNPARAVAWLKRYGWKQVGEAEYTLSGGYTAKHTPYGSGTTNLTITGPDLTLSTKTPPKLTKAMHNIMVVAWRDGLLTRDAAFSAVELKHLSKVDKFLAKLVKYDYLTPVSGGYKVTPAGMSAR